MFEAGALEFGCRSCLLIRTRFKLRPAHTRDEGRRLGRAQLPYPVPSAGDVMHIAYGTDYRPETLAHELEQAQPGLARPRYRPRAMCAAESISLAESEGSAGGFMHLPRRCSLSNHPIFLHPVAGIPGDRRGMDFRPKTDSFWFPNGASPELTPEYRDYRKRGRPVHWSYTVVYMVVKN